MFKTFLKLRAQTARISRTAQPVAILRLQAQIPGVRKQFRALFTTKEMEAHTKWLR